MGASSESGERLEGLLVCPVDRARLEPAPRIWTCTGCHRRYSVVGGIPVVLTEGRPEGHDDMDHLVGSSDRNKRDQAAFFDAAAAAEFEITRPHGTPALYSWMLERKLLTSVRGIESMLPGSTALVVCGGSGMDAEFLARRGAAVISSDISLGAAERAAERADRYNLDIIPIVADAEHLPFPDRSIDIVTVHDGLHHLEDPAAAIDEMARVAAHAISITEPADAAITDLAVKLGLALEREEAGNRVARLQIHEVAQHLQRLGFAPVSGGRYALYYRHVPGRLMRLLSHPALLPIVTALVRLTDRIVGRFGNKLTVVATRTD